MNICSFDVRLLCRMPWDNFISMKEPAMSTVIEKIFLEDLDASKNIRRACPKLSNKNIDVWDLVVKLALSGKVEDNIKFLEILSQEKGIISLAQSILSIGQIHPIIARYVGGICVCIAGQRRCVALAVAECLRKIHKFGTNADIMNATSWVWTEGLDWNFDAISKNEEGFYVIAKIVEVDDDQAERIAFEENDESIPISDLDWGHDFKRLLDSINPETGKNYTIKQVAHRRRKSYVFVRGRSALPYLPADWKEKLDAEEINITDAIKYACEIRSEAQKKSEEAFHTVTVTRADEECEKKAEPYLPISKAYIVEETMPDGSPIAHPTKSSDYLIHDEEEVDFVDDYETDKQHEEPEVVVHPPAKVKERSWTEATRKPRTKKTKEDILTASEIKVLLAETPKENLERIKAFAEVLKMDMQEAQDFAGMKDEFPD